MNRSPLFLALLLSAFPLTTQQAPETPAAHPDLANRIDAIFGEYLGRDGPGCAVGVSRDGEVIFARGYGLASVEHGLAITPGTAFNIGSVAKQFTALAALLLERRGLLSLDDDVRRFVPELPDYGTSITVRDLLRHSSGLRDYMTLETLIGARMATMDELVDLLARQGALNFTPGERHEYSHSDFELLAVVIERAAGRPFGELLERDVFSPLGMTSTRVHDERAVPIAGRAFAHTASPAGYRVLFPGSRVAGGTNVYTTVEDLLQWDRHFHPAYADREPLVDRLLGRPTLRTGEVVPYAFGLRLASYRGLPVVHRSGGGSFASEFMRFPDQGLAIATLCNVTPSHPLYLSREVAELFLEALMEPLPESSTAAGVPAPADELERYAGVYRPADVRWNLLILEARNGSLVELHGDEATALDRREDGRYEADGIVFTFTSPPDGGAVRLELAMDGTIVESLDRLSPSELWRPDAASLEEYAGDYHSRDLDRTWRIRVQDGQLVVLRRHLINEALTPVQPDVFMRMFGTYQRPVYTGLRFGRDAAGQVILFTLGTQPGEDSVQDVVFRRLQNPQDPD
jgi:CubicO group peptidase (beta-lactamase class C family)